ncbi:MAG: RidA family protein [Propionibacteriaceae bacterium]
MTVSARLKELGYDVPAVAKPLAAYVPAVRVGDEVWTSGQLPLVDGNLTIRGKVGAEVSLEEAVQAARICALNALAAAGMVAGGIDNIVRVLKATIFVASAPDFTQQPKVGNGASELLAMTFGSEGQHVRSAVGVASLPMDAPVEIELVVLVADPE